MATVPFSPESSPQEIDGQTLAQKLQTAPDTVQLIDVREPWEVEMAAIPGFANLPLSQFADWETQIHSRFEMDVETIVMCHHGIRSAQMCQWLRHQGFTHVKNLMGGIDAYAALVDPSVPRY
ncbi:MAG: rhodanese-related sulfurtransferase [Leptolyngbya sp. SIO1D8]|nr:rhodanese-related sulfurtransferase [Leptolyngbya sp. SIO1D8]